MRVFVPLFLSWICVSSAYSSTVGELPPQSLPITGISSHFGHLIRPGTPFYLGNQNSQYVRFRLSSERSEGGWKIGIYDSKDVLVEEIDGKSLQFGVWSVQVWDQLIKIEVPGNGHPVRIEKIVRSVQSLPVQNVIPKDSLPNYTPIVVHQNPSVRQMSRSVVHLRFVRDNVERPCTGFYISKDIIMTNHHCIPDEEVASTLTIYVGYLSSLTSSHGIINRGVLLAGDPILDYSFIRVSDRFASNGEPVKLRKSGPHDGEFIAIIQHPSGEAMKVADDEDCYISSAHIAGYAGSMVDFGHRCDTSDGSSGSLVLSLRDFRIIGIHHWGIRPGDSREENQGVRMDEILKDLQQKAKTDMRAKQAYDAMLNAGR